MAAWSHLPPDILGEILERLPLPDYIRFGCVCVSWNSVVKAKQFRPKSQSPWLMIPDDDEETAARFYSLSEKRTYRIHLPQPPIRRRVCIGSSHGWLITVDDISCKMHLLNPITGVQIQLPSITTLPFVDAVCDSQGRISEYIIVDDLFLRRGGTLQRNNFKMEKNVEETLRYFFLKAVLSSAPSVHGDGDFVVMMMHEPGSRLAFMRAGDKAWTPLRSQLDAKDVVLCGRSFYTTSWTGHVFAWDIDGFTDIRQHVDPMESDGFSFIPRLFSISKRSYQKLSYLINTPDGRFFVIHREQYGEETSDQVPHYTDEPELLPGYTDNVNILLLQSKARKRSLVKDMKDDVFFVGNNHSMSVSAAEFPELQRNSIYFTDDNLEFSSLTRQCRRDIGVFDMKKNCAMPLYHLGPHLSWPPPIWITPVMF